MVLLRTLSSAVIADSRDIVAQGVQPHIDHMTLVKVHRNSPFEGASGNAQILQSRKQEIIHHLIFSGHGLDESGMLVDVSDQPVGIFAHLKEVRFLLCRLHFPSAVRAFSVHKLGLRPEGFAGRTVEPFVSPLVNISLVVKLFKYFLNLLLMVFIRRPDKMVIGGIHEIPEPADGSRHIVHKFLGRDPLLLGL